MPRAGGRIGACAGATAAAEWWTAGPVVLAVGCGRYSPRSPLAGFGRPTGCDLGLDPMTLPSVWWSIKYTKHDLSKITPPPPAHSPLVRIPDEPQSRPVAR